MLASLQPEHFSIETQQPQFATQNPWLLNHPQTGKKKADRTVVHFSDSRYAQDEKIKTYMHKYNSYIRKGAHEQD